MAEQHRAIEREWADGFRDAVDCFHASWDPAVHGPEPIINGQGYKIESICRQVLPFEDHMPRDLIYELLEVTRCVEPEIRARALSERSYSAGARCLLRAIEIKTSERQMLEESRRNSGL